MQYTVVKGSSIENLSEDVSSMMREGWRPVGGITVSAIGTKSSYRWRHDFVPAVGYLQAMVKEEYYENLSGRSAED